MIEVTHLTKRYGARLAVDRLSFRVRPGQVTGFLGPNGAGKSTTMRMILGLAAPDAGSAAVNGRPYRALRAPLHEVGALLDARAVHGGRTASAHLLSLARSNGIGGRRVGEVLELAGLGSVADRRIGGFSLGMAQRLGIAAALLGDPAVLIFDEPVNGLDTNGMRWIRSLLKGLAAEGRTVFVSSHLMSEMERTADHLIVIGQGRLLANTTVRDLIGDRPPPGYRRADGEDPHRRILVKLDLRGRTQAAVFAYDTGLVRPTPEPGPAGPTRPQLPSACFAGCPGCVLAGRPRRRGVPSRRGSGRRRRACPGRARW
jgi:ABC-2 type transport system ATP-binding protein